MFEHVDINLGYEDLGYATEFKKRHYLTPEGTAYPSITTVLSILSEESIRKWRERVGEEEANKISYRAATRGTKVHEIIERYINNDGNFNDGYTPDVYASFLDIKRILDDRIGRVYVQEASLYSDYLGVAGRVDCIAEFDGKLSVIDFKTSRKPKKAEWIESYFIQETFYAIAWEERTTIPIKQLVTIIAVDGSEPQVFIEDRDNWDKKLIETIHEFKYRQRTI